MKGKKMNTTESNNFYRGYEDGLKKG